MNEFIIDNDLIIQINQSFKDKDIDIGIKSITAIFHLNETNELQIVYSDGYYLNIEQVANGIETLKQVPNEKIITLPLLKEISKEYIINSLINQY